MNPIAEARRQVEWTIAALVAGDGDQSGSLDYLVEFAASVAQSGRSTFHRELPNAFGHPYGHPTWMSVVSPEVGDRLAAADQIAFDEAAEGWTWRNDWCGALLAPWRLGTLRTWRSGCPARQSVPSRAPSHSSPTV